ncbi:MAG TPA: hypothetical protein VIS29_09240 [Streptomyces sp.]
MTVTLGELREVLGYNRLGVRVLGEIARSLQDEKLGYLPIWALEDNDVPRYRGSCVVRRGSVGPGSATTPECGGFGSKRCTGTR